MSRLFSTAPDAAAWRVDPKHPGEVLFNDLSPNMGELRGFTSDGKEAIGINSPAESNHIDLFATDLRTGKVRRLTNTEYTDPIKSSPDDKWYVDLDVHVSGRSMWVAAMDGVPPINDMVTIATVSEARNNRNRRFFQPMLVDRWGQRGSYSANRSTAVEPPAAVGSAIPTGTPTPTRPGHLTARRSFTGRHSSPRRRVAERTRWRARHRRNPEAAAPA